MKGQHSDGLLLHFMPDSKKSTPSPVTFPASAGSPDERVLQGMTRPRLVTWLLLALTVIAAWQVWQISRDFASPLVWAISLAVVALPMHSWVASRIRNRPTLAAVLSVAVITLAIVLPVALVVQSTASQVAKAVGVAQKQVKDNEWRQTVEKNPRLKQAVGWVEKQDIDVAEQLQNVAGSVGQYAGAALAGGARTITSLLLMLFFLFFLFRDRKDFLSYTRSLLPLTEKETDTLFERIKDTIQATLLGTVIVRGLQGVLGGLMFWFLGLPGALLWGAVMGMASVIPVLGAFVVWVPAAIYLAASGSVGKALILTVWGVAVIGSVDNVLYPTMVGDRLKMHTVQIGRAHV